jgi:hypothetical protein
MTTLSAYETLRLVEAYQDLCRAAGRPAPDAETIAQWIDCGGIDRLHENEIVLAEWSTDIYHGGQCPGGDLARANVTGFAVHYGHHVYTEECRTRGRAWVDIGDPMDYDTGEEWVEAVTELAATMASLQHDYPLIDDQIHAELTVQLANEAWRYWLAQDTLNDLQALGVECDDADQIADTYHTFEGNEWILEDESTAVNLRHDDAVAHVASVLRAA